jgi:hypothetical protein
MVEIPTGSLIGLAIACWFLGVIMGMSARFVRGLARSHERFHETEVTTGDTSTGSQTVTVLVDAHSQRTGAALHLTPEVAALVAELREPDGTLTPSSVAALDALAPGWRAELNVAAGEGVMCLDVASSEQRVHS